MLILTLFCTQQIFSNTLWSSVLIVARMEQQSIISPSMERRVFSTACIQQMGSGTQRGKENARRNKDYGKQLFSIRM